MKMFVQICIPYVESNTKFTPSFTYHSVLSLVYVCIVLNVMVSLSSIVHVLIILEKCAVHCVYHDILCKTENMGNISLTLCLAILFPSTFLHSKNIFTVKSVPTMKSVQTKFINTK